MISTSELNKLQKKYKIPEISVDFLNTSYTTVYSKQLDNARYIICTLTENGIPRPVSDDESARVRMKKPDNTYIYNDCKVIIDDGRVLVHFTEQMMAREGNACCDIQLISSTNNVYSTQNFYVNVGSMPWQLDAVESSNDLSSISELLQNEKDRIKQVEELNTKVTTAEQVRNEAENTRIANENTRQSNETSRNNSENERKTNETARINSEKNREANETVRKENETIRQGNEDTRKKNEQTRIASENTRLSNEEIRNDNENERISAESLRKQNETLRNEAESSRVSSENARDDAEDIRKANEVSRQTNEDDRINKEQIRSVNENERKINEASRSANETVRIEAESTRLTNETDRINAENTRTDAENARKANEEIRTNNETVRIQSENTRNVSEETRNTAESTRNTNENTRILNETERNKKETERQNAETNRATEFSSLKSNMESVTSASEKVNVEVISSEDVYQIKTTDRTNTSSTSPNLLNKIQIGTVQTGEYDEDASASLVGAFGEQKLNLRIPIGKPFKISKTYSSVDAMEKSIETDLGLYEFCMINTGSVEDEDTGKLYMRDVDGAAYITDLSGVQGIQGVKGDTGLTPNLTIGTVTTGEEGTQASATISGTAENPIINLVIPRGNKGTIDNASSASIMYELNGSESIKDVIDQIRQDVDSKVILGETSSTAYRGDRGKIAYDHSQSTHARTDATKVEKSTTNGNIKINGTEITVYTHPSGTNPHGTTKSDVGLSNVGNFKAVSTVASQGLTEAEKANARANIGAGASSFSGDYNDLTNKPTIPSVGNGTITITQNGTTKGTFTTNQSGNTTIELTDNNTDTKNTAGSTDTSSKIFLVGATSQSANPQTYSDNEVYTTSGVLTTKSVQVGGGAVTIQYNSSTESIDFVFS